MRGSGWASASSASVTGRSGSYWTAMRASAAAAASSVVAATAATGSPTKRTLSSASACSSWLAGRIPTGIGRSLPVSTALTPASAAAGEASIETMRAWAWGLRSSLAYSMRGRNRSSANLVVPVTFAVASTFRSAFPTTRKAGLPDAIHALRCWLGRLAAHAGRGQLHGLVDLDVARAAAEVARQRLLDVVPAGAGVPREQGLGSEQERRGAIAALRRAELGEGVLQGVQLAAAGHSFDRAHAPSRTGEAEHQTREYGGVVDEHGARAALTQLAAVLGAREAQVLAQHLEQRLVRREGHLDGIAVHVERDLRLGVGHGCIVTLISRRGDASFPPPSDLGRLMLRRSPVALLLLALYPCTRLPAQDFRAQALRILKTVPLIDGHNDIPDAIRERGGLDSVDFAVPQPKLMTDIPKLRAGGGAAPVWGAYVPAPTMGSGPQPAGDGLGRIDLIKRLCAKYPRDLAIARTAADVERNFKAGKGPGLIGIEGGDALGKSLGGPRRVAAL